MPREDTPGGPIFDSPYPFPDNRRRNRYPRTPFPGFPDLKIPGGLEDTIFRERYPSRESCAKCRSRQNPYEMHFADPCANECSGGAGDIKIPDPRLPYPTFPDRYPEPRPGSAIDPFDFPPVNSRNRGVGGALIPAAQLLGEFLGKLMK